MDVERARHFETVFPPEVLVKLKPYAQDIGEVLRWNADFPHQKFHTLDALLHLRYYDHACLEHQRIMDNMDWEDRAKYPEWTDWWGYADLPTYDRIERALRLHDTGRFFVENGVLRPEEHHYGSLFVAMHADGDPIVWDAVYHHIDDVSSENESIVSEYVRALDRIVGAGYVGLIRTSAYHGFSHPLLEERDEDKVISDGVMMAIPDRFWKPDEEKATDFFWGNIYPYFESGGEDKFKLLGTLSKIMLDRIVGRDYSKLERKLTVAEKEVLRLDNNSQVVEGIPPRLRGVFEYKLRNTLDVLIRTRGGHSLKDSFLVLTQDERKSYLWPI